MILPNQIHNAFKDVKASDELKQSTLEYIRQEQEKASHGKLQHLKFVKMRKVIVAVCSVLIILSALGGHSALASPAYYVSIDVNPSMELTLNQLERVIAVKAYNEDGEMILQDMSVNGKQYTDAIADIMESEKMKPYLTADSGLTFTIAAKDSRKGEALQREIDQSKGCQEHHGKSVVSDMKNVEEAHGNGLSLGKYSAYLKLKEYDNNVTIETCHHMTMADMNRQIHKHEEECTNNSNQKGHHKDGHSCDE